ncbi:hypothetical protein SDC9_153911 [bioreactor metagenome]|uniref:NADPH-dependent FMN reductase-like domain-containing protein n=1 Tax=bioreactor metagenome TaxID=1076179 RepID=A0A645EX81_9ZZZZ
MKVLLVNGSPHEKGCTYTALGETAKTLNEEGIATEVFLDRHQAAVGVCRLQGLCKAGPLRIQRLRE